MHLQESQMTNVMANGELEQNNKDQVKTFLSCILMINVLSKGSVHAVFFKQYSWSLYSILHCKSLMLQEQFVFSEVRGFMSRTVFFNYLITEVSFQK